MSTAYRDLINLTKIENALRQKALDRFRQLGFPNRKLEAWKYTNLEPVLNSPFQKEAPASESFSPEQQSLIEALTEQQLAETTNPFEAINAFQFQRIKLIEKPGQEHLEVTDVAPRIVIALKENAELHLVLEHRSESLMNESILVQLGRNARLNLTSIHRNQPGALQMSTTRVWQEEGSVFERVAYHTGGTLLRSQVDVDFEGPRAECSLFGLSILDRESQAFDHLTVRHRVPECTSRQSYKNILAGKSQAEFNSMAHVFRGAQKSVSQQLDRNLLLSPEARAYSRPQLKIDADDVQCNHGAATGHLGEDDLFYLRSRGIKKAEARYLLTYGFARDILEQVKDKNLRAQLEKDAQEKIKGMTS